MRQGIRSQLTFANVVSVIALFLALGGTALASVIISSNSQVAQNTISGHTAYDGNHPNIIAGSVNSKDVTDNSLDGTDIKDRSGVDTCRAPLTAKFGPICAGSDGGARNWGDAFNYCSGFGLRLPTLSEAITLAKNYDVPGVSGTQTFWTDAETTYGSSLVVRVVQDDGDFSTLSTEGATNQTVCVTDPSA